ncbi:linear amide C-N hydrolase [Pseudoalteromonas mariniglutinosa]|uniref:linear amide C-N hydrolase n=1 Tax=Pseudoalteromonas mariniglutinosa TaxID=206042 RepID=UPI00384BA3AD
MLIKKRLITKLLSASVVCTLSVSSAYACTSLLYTDLNGHAYAGRTMELPMELPYKMVFVPTQTRFGSTADKHHPLEFTAKHSFVGVGVADPISGDIKIVEGVNDNGLTFSLLAFADTAGPEDMINKTTSVLAAIDMGAWTLSQFKNVNDVKNALEKQPVLVTSLLPLGQLKTPFHYTLHDASGKSIVIEYSKGKQHVIDNPLGVMTNGPEFDWHMTNMNNYTFLNNEDQSKLEINKVKFIQPDSGIATAGLPSSNTSVGRFVRAVYYSQFAEKAKKPNQAISTLSHVMNNFDRPRGITIDNRFKDSIANITAPGLSDKKVYTTEYTSWTSLTDTKRKKIFIRTYNSMNYISFDLTKLASSRKILKVDLANIGEQITDGTKVLLSSN